MFSLMCKVNGKIFLHAQVCTCGAEKERFTYMNPKKKNLSAEINSLWLAEGPNFMNDKSLVAIY